MTGLVPDVRRPGRGGRPRHGLRAQPARRRRRRRRQAAGRGARADGRLRPRHAHHLRPARPSSTTGITLQEAEAQVLDYIRSGCPSRARRRSAATPSATDRGFLARDMPDAGVLPALPDHRRQLDQGAVAPLVSPRLLQRPQEVRRPPRPRRHPRVDRRAALLPRGRLRARSPGPDSATAKALARPTSSSTDRCPSTASTARAYAVRRGGHEHLARACSDCRRRDTAPSPRARLVLCMVGVAQLVEHLVVVQVAAGSSPVTHPMVLLGRTIAWPGAPREGHRPRAFRGHLTAVTHVIRTEAPDGARHDGGSDRI